MATITAKLTLQGDGITSDALSIIQTSVLNVANPAIESGTLNVTDTAALLLPATAKRVYLYVKNTGTPTVSPNVNIQIVASTANIAELAPGEWLFFPVEESLVLNVDSATASKTSTVEYSYFAAG